MRRIKILFLADLHGVDYFSWNSFFKIDKNSFDVIITLGDIDVMLLSSIRENFKDKRILGVYGNHDYVGDLEHYNVENIHGKIVSLSNFLVGGLEGCLDYKKHNQLLHDDHEIIRILNSFDTIPDMIVSHNSPYEIHDKVDKAHRGYLGLRFYLKDYRTPPSSKVGDE